MSTRPSEVATNPTEKQQDILDFDSVVRAVRRGDHDPDSASRALLSLLTTSERLWLLDGDEEFWPGLYSLTTEGFNHVPYVHGEIKRLNIPGVRFSDGPRGCVMGKSTAFPVPMARGATWDIALEERIGRAIGRECRAQGANLYGGVCVNLPRYPAWGRIQETFGEDPILLGEMGAALTKGVQESVMACVKHFALNSTENTRFVVDVNVDEAILHQTYLPHFRRIVEEGVAVVMSSYNSVRGEFAGQNEELLRDILRNQWAFKGFVISDFLFGFRDVALSLRSGLDLEAPFRQQRFHHLEKALQKGQVSNADIDRAGTAIIGSLIEHEVLRGGSKPGMDVVFCDEHRDLSREAAAKSMVLLKNDDVHGEPLLPLSNVSTIAVLGRLADSISTGDKGSSAVRCPQVTSAYKGLKEAFPEATIELETSEHVERVKATAAAAEVAIVVVGYTFLEEGEFTAPAFNGTPALRPVIPPSDGSREAESVITRLMTPKPTKEEKGKDNYGFGTGGDRTSLRLRPQDVEVIRAAVEANSRTIVSIIAGGAVIIEEWKQLTPAIVYSWYSGCEGGHALADLLRGHENFAGRLPFCIPTTEDHIPQLDIDAVELAYDQWFGQRKLDLLQVPAAYPLGFGLSYTRFTLSNMELEPGQLHDDKLITRVHVLNVGERSGRCIIQIYATVEVDDWPKRNLLGFQAVDLNNGEEKAVRVQVSIRPLQRWHEGNWTLVCRTVGIEVGKFSGDPESLRASHTFRDSEMGS